MIFETKLSDFDSIKMPIDLIESRGFMQEAHPWAYDRTADKRVWKNNEYH